MLASACVQDRVRRARTDEPIGKASNSAAQFSLDTTPSLCRTVLRNPRHGAQRGRCLSPHRPGIWLPMDSEALAISLVNLGGISFQTKPMLYVVLRASLSNLVAIDVHPRAFRVGSVWLDLQDRVRYDY
jgi:hypothetical protein